MRPPGDPAKETFLRRFARNAAVQDWAVVVYFCVLAIAVQVGRGPGWESSFYTVLADLAIFVLALALVRGEILEPERRASGIVYRFGIFGPVFLSYFQLRNLIPSVVSQRALDADLFALDLQLFHYEPSVAWDRYVTPSTVEWFAFFYALYFLIAAVFVLPWLLRGKDSPELRSLGLGVLAVFLVGHLTYLMVPGYGPYHHLQFEHPLTGGFFWKIVLDAVHHDGALRDIFPSLHTAVPTFVLLFSFVHRRAFPFRYTWIPLSFIVSQIVIATMFLRWHYLIDIIAGLLLALGAVVIGEKIGRWEAAARERRGAHTVFSGAPLARHAPDRPIPASAVGEGSGARRP